MPTDEVYNKRWWLVPLFFTAALIALAITAWRVSETAREILAKAFFNIAGAVSTPFILEFSVAIVGLCAVLAYNQWRMHKNGDDWVYLAVTEPDPVVLEQKPDLSADLEARLAIVEGYLELGLKKEALDHLDLLTATERTLPQAQTLRALAQTKSA